MVPAVAGVMDDAKKAGSNQVGQRKAWEERLRIEVTEILADGLETRIAPIPEDNYQFAVIVDELEKLDPDDTVGKLVVSGYIDHPHPGNKQRCLECIYYKPRQRWCVLPELDLPAEAEWWCRLWRM